MADRPSRSCGSGDRNRRTLREGFDAQNVDGYYVLTLLLNFKIVNILASLAVAQN